MANRPTTDSRTDTEVAAFFTDVTTPLVLDGTLTEGTMMGYLCVRRRDEFVAMPEHRSGDLVVKLPATRVAEVVASGDGTGFGPGGRVFKEWVRVARRDESLWLGLIGEAAAFADPTIADPTADGGTEGAGNG